MKTSDLIFIGIKGSVVALDLNTGQQVWATPLKSSDFVNVCLEQDRVIATCCGEVFCLKPRTGEICWHNPLKGFGRGLATMAVGTSPLAGSSSVMAAKRRQDEEVTAAATVAVVAAG